MLRQVESDMMRVLRMSFAEACACRHLASVAGRSVTVCIGCWSWLRSGCSPSSLTIGWCLEEREPNGGDGWTCRLAGGVGSCRRAVGRLLERLRADKSEVSHSLSGGAIDVERGVSISVGTPGDRGSNWFDRVMNAAAVLSITDFLNECLGLGRCQGVNPVPTWSHCWVGCVQSSSGWGEGWDDKGEAGADMVLLEVETSSPWNCASWPLISFTDCVRDTTASHNCLIVTSLFLSSLLFVISSNVL